MQLTFLGTGTSQGVPIIGCQCRVCTSSNPKDNRLRCSSLITTDAGANILIDIGPDFRQQALTQQISHIDAILLTHEHNDHTGGLDDIRPFNFQQRSAIPLYAEQRVLEAISTRFDYVFSAAKYPGIPELNLIPLQVMEAITFQDLEIIPIRIMHGALPIVGFKMGNLCYITDVKFISQEVMEFIEGTEVLIISALRHTQHNTHCTLKESIQYATSIRAKHTYFIHMSHQIGLHDEISKTLAHNMHFAYDGLKLNL